jgi:hypothetical protein
MSFQLSGTVLIQYIGTSNGSPFATISPMLKLGNCSDALRDSRGGYFSDFIRHPREPRALFALFLLVTDNPRLDRHLYAAVAVSAQRLCARLIDCRIAWTGNSRFDTFPSTPQEGGVYD